MSDAITTERWVSQVLAAELLTEKKAHAKTLRDLRVALGVMVLNTILLIVLAVKYLHVVDLPKARCLERTAMTV